MHQVAVLFSLAEKTKPWTGVAGAFVEHQYLFKTKSQKMTTTGVIEIFIKLFYFLGCFPQERLPTFLKHFPIAKHQFSQQGSQR